jgi:hypothetical protein
MEESWRNTMRMEQGTGLSSPQNDHATGTAETQEKLSAGGGAIALGEPRFPNRM